jgi:rubrerythrin
MQPNHAQECEVWERYNSLPRILTPEYIRCIPWERLLPCPSDDFAKALMIASDVETATYDIFFLRELAPTASARDPIISAFMKRWVGEELTHGELLRKLLSHWGYDHRYVTPRFGLQTRLAAVFIRWWGNWFGEQFKALHMIWGGINELTARETYRRLRESSTDAVVRLVLGAIIKEESIHANFYLGMAAAKTHSGVTRLLCRLAFRRWKPVGAWNKKRDEMGPVLGLFVGEHLHSFDRNVTKEFERRLPAFAGSGLTAILEKLVRSALGPGSAGASWLSRPNKDVLAQAAPIRRV